MEDSTLIVNIGKVCASAMVYMSVRENKHKKTFVTSTEEDRISKLPDNLVDSILELLPVQDAVRTSILSRNWRYRWTTMRSLVLDKHFSEKFVQNGAFGRNGFIRIVNQVFNFLKGPILKLHLHIPNMNLDSFQEVDQSILSLSRHGARELVLTNSNQHYQIPSYLFHCLELRKLENCTFKKPPFEFQGYLHLKDLHLKNIEFRADLNGTVINLPQLSMLQLNSCTNAYNFNIKATNLKVLAVMYCPDAVLLCLLYKTCLTKVVIVVNKPILRNERINLATILSNLPYLEVFSMNGYFLKLSVAEKIPKWLPYTANRLKILLLVSINFGDLDQLQGALFMLRNSPNLEKLFLRNPQMPMHFDVTSASSYLEASDCLGQTLNQLKTVEITHIEGSRPLLLFIKILLDKSPTLEKMSIQPTVTADAHKRLDFAKDVMQFPRASSRAEVLYLDL